MSKFGLYFEGNLNRLRKVPHGFAEAVVIMGEYSETTIVDMGIWSVDQYEHSWMLAAKRLLEVDRSIFCSSLSGDNLTLWIATRGKIEDYIFSNSIVRREDVDIKNMQIDASRSFYDDIESVSNRSIWKVEGRYIEEYCNSGR